MNDFKEKCLKESGTDRDAAENFLDSYDFPEDKKFKCYLKCIFANFGTMDNKINLLDMKLFDEAVGSPDTSLIHENCLGFKNDDLCDKTFLISKCIYKTVKQQMAGDNI